jgi:TolB protein
MNADGSNQHRIGTFDGGGPDWSRDGSKIVFYSNMNGIYHICVADTDGTNFQQLTNIGTENWWPSSSADGNKIAFQSNRDGNHEIYVMNADGTNPVRLTSNTAEDGDPCWSPDGSRIAFSSLRDGKYEIYKMNASDGSGQTRLTSMQVHNIQPNWGSVRVPLKKYLGQTPPDTILVRFGPSYLISDGTWGWHGSPQFSPDGKEMFFVKYYFNLPSGNAKLYRMKVVNGEWTSPVQPSFASDSIDNSPVYSRDGNTLYFLSFRDGSAKIYYVTRIADDWSQPQKLNVDYQTLPGSLGWCFSLIRDSVLYIEVSTQEQGDIYRSPLVNGQYSQFEKLSDSINSTSGDGAPYVEVNENYIIFISNKPGGYGYHDLYISFKNSDGTWTSAKNMGNKINGSNEDFMASITPDGDYMFFNSAKTGDLGYNAYWLSASVIEKWRPIQIDTTQKITFESWRDGNAEIYMMNYDGGSVKRLTLNSDEDRWPGFSRDGMKIIFCSNRNGNYEVYTMDNNGDSQLRLTSTSDIDEVSPDWSPDRKKIAYVVSPNGNWLISEIHVMKANGTGDTAITGNASGDSRPIWSPDGSKILFFSKRDGHYEIYVMNANGSNQTRLTYSSTNAALAQWSPDGSKIVYNELDIPTMTGQIHVMNSDGSNDTVLTNAAGINENSCWSADGRYIVFQSNRNGNYEVYIMNANGSNQQNLTNNSAWDSWPSCVVIQLPDTVLHYFPYQSGWNQISVPFLRNDNRKDSVFGASVSDAFFYDADSEKYISKDTLENGKGYWLKFPLAGVTVIQGDPILVDTIEVKAGWNMIGSISEPVTAASIGSLPAGITTSEFYTYQSGYVRSDTIHPGIGYWVKLEEEGSLILAADETITLGHGICIKPTRELPPSPPEYAGSKTNNLPEQFGLSQNYPNPFNPVTTIRYNIPLESKVTLRIYNVLGQVVSQVVNELQNAGFKSVEWKADGMASGLYFCRLEAVDIRNTSNSFVQIMKMILIR